MLKADTWFGADSVTVGLFGNNVSRQQIKMLAGLEVDKVVLMIDSDFEQTSGADFEAFKDKVEELARALKPYFAVEVCYNNVGLDGYKCSPFDFSREEFDMMYENREVVA